ncbi:4-alpha-glucanotransferase [Gulosibacter chungangensis]|uniref:4-alpha-glucanotransferase n=1 Tax=Gulosibacter chungangensis TaxID=979746 RepID=A0A7J5BBA4_9MICO|nr:4-alpha-glucanotransferase [Gulosibacter chungangensis]KAB1643430.1 4-alpha-glucanotransferase [Gulosibacter chungangensis]
MSALTSTQVLAELAERYGISSNYHDWLGEYVEVSPEVLVAVLAALDVDAATEEAAQAALDAADERPWRQTLPPTTVARTGAATEFFVHVPAGEPVTVTIHLEDGAVRDARQLEHLVEPRVIDAAPVGEAKFQLPADLPLGWHEIRAVVGNTAEAAADGAAGSGPVATATLIVTPDAASTQLDARAWGIMAQLYQARSAESWGIGDLRDLRTIGQWGAEHGADFVLVNPFHAPSVTTPIEPSPYLPTSRRFSDPSLLRIEDLAEVLELHEAEAQRLLELASYGQAANRVDAIDRDASWLAKREALGICFEAARRGDHDRWRAFGNYCEIEGQSLIDFATWCALCEQLGGNWRDWPEAFQDPGNDAVDEFRQQHADRIEFYCWVQFSLQEQKERTQQALREAGMQIGVMNDLAVGVHPSGADAWSLNHSLARGVSVGAPPDAYNQMGQDWSQPPLRPDALERTGYAPLRDMLRKAFVGAGALRIDHILGMFRQWWVPAGMPASQGTFVTFDHEAMIGVLLLEAERAGALVIGEDLGTVSKLTREVMADRHVYGTQIMWFEREDDGTPKRPEHYRQECLASVTTHDLPPTAGYLELAHVDLRERLGVLTRPAEDERADERATIAAYTDILREEGLIGADAPTTEELVLALHRHMARSNSQLFQVALADLAGDRRPINQPGTYREYPNWTLPLTGPDGQLRLLDEVLADEFAGQLAEAAVRPQAE